MKKLSKNWALWEIIFLLTSILTISICFFISPEKSVLSFISSICGITTVFFLAKGLFFAPITDIIYNCLYAAVSIVSLYYGEAIIYIFVMMPISISSLITWFKNKNKDESTVKVNKIKGKEWGFLSIACVAITIGFYFLLKVLNTSQLFVSTISIITSVIGAYLLLRRSSYYAIAFILNDIILIVLWGLTTLTNGLMYLPTTLSFIVFLINDTYGFIRWKKEEKKLIKEQENKDI